MGGMAPATTHTQSTHLQINPDLPVLWEDPTTIRVGFEHAVARVEAASPAAQTLIAYLIRGVARDELARQNPRVAGRILEALSPVLIEQREFEEHPVPLPKLRKAPHNPAASLHPSDARAADGPQRAHAHRLSRSRRGGGVLARIYDDGRELPAFQSALEIHGQLSFARGSTQPSLAIEVLRFLEPLGRTSRWLSSGTAHLIVRLTDAAARIGPLVSPHGAPCHGCETLQLTDEDPALPALASQLYGTLPNSETASVGLIAGGIAGHFVHAWQNGESWVHDHQAVLPVTQGLASAMPVLARVRTHPECGCSVIGAAQPQRQSATAA